MNISQGYSKRLKESNKFYWFTLAIISILVIGINVYLVVRRPTSIVQQAQSYLTPLPTNVNLDLLQDLKVLQDNTPMSPREFYKLVLKYSTPTNNVNPQQH